MPFAGKEVSGTEALKEFTFTVVLQPETDPDFPGYYNVHVPALPGCLTYGANKQEALANAREAILGYLETLEKEGLPIPTDEAASVEKVTVAR